MTSSISWIDRDSLEATLARFGVGGRRPPARAAEQSVHERWSGNGAPAPRPSAQLSEPDEIPEFTPPKEPLRQRLEAFLGWLQNLSGSRVAFIVDRDGLPLVDRKAAPDLLAVASSMMELVEDINSQLLLPIGKTVTLELEEDLLILQSVETPIGRYIVGQVATHPMAREIQQAVSQALRRAFRPQITSEQVVGREQ